MKTQVQWIEEYNQMITINWFSAVASLVFGVGFYVEHEYKLAVAAFATAVFAVALTWALRAVVARGLVKLQAAQRTRVRALRP